MYFLCRLLLNSWAVLVLQMEQKGSVKIYSKFIYTAAFRHKAIQSVYRCRICSPPRKQMAFVKLKQETYKKIEELKWFGRPETSVQASLREKSTREGKEIQSIQLFQCPSSICAELVQILAEVKKLETNHSSNKLSTSFSLVCGLASTTFTYVILLRPPLRG